MCDTNGAVGCRMPLRIVEGDLLDQPADAIVNAWNRNVIPWWLLIPQGVSGAVKRRAGYAPFRELGYRPLPLGDARHTSAGRLPLRGIIHVAAIDMLWRASEDSVERSTRSALAMASAHGYRTLAMPLLGSGSGGLSEARSERVMTEVLERAIEMDVTLVRFAKG